MKLLKKFAVVCMISLFSMSMVGCSIGGKSDAVAKVGSVYVDKKPYQDQMKYIQQYLSQVYGEDYMNDESAKEFFETQREQVVTSLVQQEVLMQKAKKMDIAATDEEIEEKFNTVKDYYETEEEFKEDLEKNDFTEESYRVELGKMIVIEKMQDEIIKDVAVTDQEIKDYYDQNQSLYAIGAGAQVSHILLKTEEEAKAVKADYEAGKDSFENLAKEKSEDTGSASAGGSIGFVEYDSTAYDQDFLAGMKDLKEGEVSDPVKSQFGWHIIKVAEVQKEESVTPLEDVSEQIKAQLMSEKQQEVFFAQLDEWSKELNVKLYEENWELPPLEVTPAPSEAAEEGTTTEDTTTEDTTTEDTTTEDTTTEDTTTEDTTTEDTATEDTTTEDTATE